MAYLNESHIEVANIRFFTDTLGYSHIDGWEKQLLGRKSLKEMVMIELKNATEKYKQGLIRT